MCFTASKGNHDPAVVSQAKTASGQVRIDWECTGPQSGDGGQLGVGGFEVMLELMGICIELDDAHHSPRTRRGVSGKCGKKKKLRPHYRRSSNVKVWKPSEYALHSGRIGGATRLAAMGLSTYDIQ